MVTLETQRLLLRRFRQEDFDEYAAIFSDPEVTRYLGDSEPLSRVAAWLSWWDIGNCEAMGCGQLRSAKAEL